MVSATFEADQRVNVCGGDLGQTTNLEAAEIAAVDQVVDRLAAAAEFGGCFSRGVGDPPAE